MSVHRDFSRFSKMAPLIALVGVVALILAGVILAFHNERQYRAQKIGEVSVQGDILASTVTAALAFGDRKAAQEYVGALRANPEIQTAIIYDIDGSIFASYLRDAGGRRPDLEKIGRSKFADDHVTVVKPVFQGATLLGTVYLQTVPEPLSLRLGRYGVVVLLVTMGSLVVAVLGVAQAALTRANSELARRAFDLAQANRDLQTQIEERERVEEALRHSQKMEAIGQLSGGIAHDFNNFLAVIMGNLQLLQRRLAAGRTDVARYVTLAIEGVNKASNLTQRILAFSRRQPLSPKPVDLSRLCLEMGDLLRHSVGELISIETRLTSDWWTECDPSQMENAILNLAINARDAMPQGGTLTIATEDLHLASPSASFKGIAKGDYVLLSVKDTGVGMPEEVRARAIDPFFTTKPLGQGTGLGLSMIYGFVQQSSGYLLIDSAPGKGTSVRVFMPRHHHVELPAGTIDQLRLAGAVDGAAAPAGAKIPTVLIVEDQELLRALAAESMRDQGFNVIEKGDGAAALDLIKTDASIDVLVSDIRLPGINGYQLTEAATTERPSLKVLLMTGYSHDPVPEKLVKGGIEVLYKPFNLGDLTARVQQLIDA